MKPKRRAVCRHCHNPKVTVNRPRGLCWACYYTPELKELYPSTSKFARRGAVPDRVGPHPPLPVPTDSALPGTPEKLEILQSRAASGFAIFHPHDARYSLK